MRRKRAWLSAGRSFGRGVFGGVESLADRWMAGLGGGSPSAALSGAAVSGSRVSKSREKP
jgi:hypothetical protein